MNTPIFNICKSGECGLVVTGKSAYENMDFSYNDSVTINILSSLDSTYNITKTGLKINDHQLDVDEVIFNFFSDGLHKIQHIIVPTIQWLHSYIQTEKHLPYKDNIYVYVPSGYWTGVIDSVYQLKDSVELTDIQSLDTIPMDLFNLINIDQLIELCESDPNDAQVTSTLLFDYKHTFATCNLQKCYYKFCQSYLQNLCTGKCSQQNIQNRDIIWMALNTINYLLDLERYAEAQSILEEINRCSGLCNKISVKQGGSSCGCSSRN